VAVAKVERGDNLPKKTTSLLGSKPSLLDEIVEQFASTHVFENEIAKGQLR